MLRRAAFAILLSLAACKSRAKPPPAPEAAITTNAATAPTAPDEDEGTQPLARSIDPPSSPGALAPNLRGEGDDVLATWLEPVSPAAEAAHCLRFSRWAKGAWSAPVTIVEGPRLVANWADVPSVARAGDGALVAHWAEASGGEAHAYDAIVARSVDGGATWTRLGALHDDATPTEHGFVSLLGEADAVRAFWLDGRATGSAGGAMTLRTATISGGNATTTNHNATTTNHNATTTNHNATTTNHNATTTNHNATTTNQHAATSNRNGITTTTAITGDQLIDDRVCDCCGTAAAATSKGALVAYRDRGADEVRDIAVARHTAAPAWTSPSPVHRDGWQIAGCPVNGPALAARGDRVAIAWYTYAESTHRIRAAFSDDAGASFSAPIEVDTPRAGRAPLGRVSIALADDGSAVVGYLASRRENAQILLRRVTRDGALGPELSLGDNLAGRDAGVPRMARAGDDLVMIWTQSGSPPRLRAVAIALAELPLAAPSTATAASAEPRSGKPEASVAPAAPPIAIGQPAPSLEAVTLEGAAAKLAELRGRVVLVNLWAIWCEPCRQELPVLASLHARDAQRGLSIVAINIDRKRTRNEISEYVTRRKLPFTIWLDPADRAASTLGATAFPFNVLVGRDGRIAWSRAGAIRAEDPELRAALDTALATALDAAPAPAPSGER